VGGNLAQGGYVVTWRVISADSHPVHGAFTFQVGAGGAAGAASAQASRAEAARLLAAGAGSGTVGVLFGILRFLGFAALFLLVGGAGFVAGLWPAGASERRARQLLWAALIASVLTTALAICLQGPYGGGLPLSDMVKPTVVSDVVRTRFGEVYLGRLILLMAVATPLLAALLRPGRRPRWWTPVAIVTAAALLITPGLAGHAGTGSLVALAIPFDLIHVAGAAVWVGGLAMLAIVVLTRRPEEASLRPVVIRYSQTALVAVAAIAVTGGFAAWRQVGSWSAVTSTTFGRLLLAKTIIFAALVTVAAFSRQLVHGSLALPLGLSRPPRGDGRTSRPAGSLSPGSGATASKRRPTVASRSNRQRQWRVRLRLSVLVELGLVAAILAVTAGLVNAQPARSALALPYSTEVHAGPTVLVDVIVDPAKAGPVAVHIYTLTPDGAQLDVPDVSAYFSLSSAGIHDLPVPLEKAGPGHFLNTEFQVPLRGTWTLQLTVHTTSSHEVYADPITVHMR
jgi:copper transport protein